MVKKYNINKKVCSKKHKNSNISFFTSLKEKTIEYKLILFAIIFAVILFYIMRDHRGFQTLQKAITGLSFNLAIRILIDFVISVSIVILVAFVVYFLINMLFKMCHINIYMRDYIFKNKLAVTIIMLFFVVLVYSFLSIDTNYMEAFYIWLSMCGIAILIQAKK